MLWNGQDDDRNVEPRVADLLDQLGPLDPALHQQVDHDHVGAQLANGLEDLRAVAEDVQQGHLGLHAEQVPDVLSDLRDVFRYEQPNRSCAGHGSDYSKVAGRALPRLRATTIARSSYGSMGSRS